MARIVVVGAGVCGAGVRFPLAMAYDADVFRAFLEVVSVQTLPSAVMARPGMIERIMAAAERGPLLIPGPNREELLDLVA
jgi:hypothetical protein